MTVMLFARYTTVGGQAYSRISFRSDDDNDDVPSSGGTSAQLRRDEFPRRHLFSRLSVRVLPSLSLPRQDSYNFLRIPSLSLAIAQMDVRVHLQRP